jgi:hypothetical protein
MVYLQTTYMNYVLILANLPIVLSVLLWLMASDYPFGIFKHVLTFCPFSFGYCVVYPPSIYGICLPFGIFLISLDLCVFYCGLLFVPLSSFFWPLCCLSFFRPLCCLSFGHYVVCVSATMLSVFRPLCCLSFGHYVVCLSATMFSVILPFTASDYPFVIFKQFSSIDQTYINYAAGTSSFWKDSMLVIFLVFCVVLCFRPVSYVPSQCFWIVHSWLSLRFSLTVSQQNRVAATWWKHFLLF